MSPNPASLRIAAIALVLGSLVACASKPVEPSAPAVDATARSTVAPSAPATAQSAVAPVRAAPPAASAAAPVSASRIVYFDYDSATIRAEFQAALDAHARWLATHRDRRVTIAGHTDERGGREYNLALGSQRADAVRRALQLLGVQSAQIETISFGEEKPAMEAHTEAAWSQNRRAELRY
ncbi:peptidoglycan-associated lipoprotein Pal [Ramlibacter sp.]|uniref:peptidoglycan-associated lipoprotein Pal n=1 Tax=Ramlibacter sp. TaxID=1917967 RepID=UPI003D13B504